MGNPQAQTAQAIDCPFTRHNPGKDIPVFSQDFVYIRVKGNATDIGLLQYGSKLNEIAPNLVYDPTPYWKPFCHVNVYSQKMREIRGCNR
ncbi:MAG: hypothetical protein A2W25_11635 [candidate division Zixibacteria bacterium RBG_16_53_22]|nr:MAG: hypothetical protein A2W25_11635 [candidate division Zixibacteria bacterium RBG_16_53_22]